MRHRSLPVGIFAIACGLLLGATTAEAVPETWVSGTGANAGTCPITAPCKTFQFAHGKTNDGGSINVLSSGNFGALTITKSISIVADGVEAVINTATAGGAAIIVNGSGIVVSLRGLTIDLTADIGISFVAGAALHVQDCVIRRTVYGIKFAPASGAPELYVADSVIANSSINNIFVTPSGSAGAKVVFGRVRVENASNDGILLSGAVTTGAISTTVHDSVLAGNGSHGILASKFGSGTNNVMIDRTASVNNSDTGIKVLGAGATIQIGDSTVSGNGTGLAAINGGVLASYGTNEVNGNGTDVAGTITPVAYK